MPGILPLMERLIRITIVLTISQVYQLEVAGKSDFKYKQCICKNERMLACVDDYYGVLADQSKCKDGTTQQIHISDCVVPQACLYRWRPRAWSDCSSICGTGTRTRDVPCKRRGKHGRQFPDIYCQFVKRPPKVEECINECGLSLTIGNWSECSVSCGGGYKYRLVLCTKTYPNGTTEDSFKCDTRGLANIVESCNTQKCDQQPEIHLRESLLGKSQTFSSRQRRGKEGKPLIRAGNRNHWVITWYQQLTADVGDRISAVKGTHVTLKCKFDGNPRPSITWIHNGQVVDYIFDQNIRISERGSESHLNIKNLDGRYIGEYTCLATNKVGYAMERAWIRQIIQGQATIMSKRSEMTFKPQDNEVTVTIGTNVTVYDGTQLTLKCPVRVIPPRYIVRWRKQGSISQSTKITRTGKNGNDLTLHDVSALDSGVYSCEARSLFGDDSQSSFVTVLQKMKPEILTKNKDVKGFGTNLRVSATIGDKIYVSVGTQVVISCPVSGIPKPSIYWRRRGIRLTFSNNLVKTFSDGRTLTINDVGKDDADTYTCVAVNSMGTDEKSSQLTVVPKGSVKPSIVSSTGERFIDSSDSNLATVGEQLKVVKGRSVIIRCPVDGSPVPDVKWYLDGVPVNQRLKKNYVIDHSGTSLFLLNVEQGMEGTYKCEAINYLGSDSKGSILVVKAQSAPIIRSGSQSIIYGQSDSKLIITIGDTLKTSAGRQLVIFCPVSGIPQPNIIWKKDKIALKAGNGIELLDGDKKLQIEKLKESHTGIFECFATNPAGIARSYSVIRVLARAGPVITSFEGSMSYLGKEKKVDVTIGTNVTVLAGKDLNIDCPYEALPAFANDMQIEWIIDGNKVAFDRKVSKEGTTLIIRNLQMFDQGIYSCIVSNNFGSDTMVTKVHVSASPHSIDLEKEPSKTRKAFAVPVDDAPLSVVSGGNVSVVEGSTLRIKCPLHGSPRPTLTWWRNGIPIISGDKYHVEGDVLVVKDANLQDAGEITCHASSLLGNSFSRTMLTVLDTERPTILRKNGTIIRKNMQHSVEATAGSQLYAVAGMTVRLLCPVKGFPKPKIQWFFNGKVVQSNLGFVQEKETDTLVIPRLQLDLEGIYNCSASNPYGVDTATVLVVTMASTSPRILKSKQSHVSQKNSRRMLNINIGDFAKVYAGQEIMIACKAHGVPAPNINWHKDGDILRKTSDVTIMANGTLRITNMKEKHSGQYLCLATNSKGVDSFTSDLVVLGKNVAMIVPSPIKQVVFANPKDKEVFALIGSNITTMEGKTLKLGCKVQGQDYKGPVWYKYGIVIHQTPRVQVQNDGTLVIKNLRVDDAGLYKCQVRTEEVVDEVFSFLKVAVPAERLIIRPKQTVVEDLDPKSVLEATECSIGTHLTVLVGKIVSLHCPTQGSMRAKITWFKGGKRVKDDNNHLLKEEQIVLSNLLTPGSYNYSCKAETFLGQAWMSSLINVIEPKRPTVIAERSQNQVVTGDVTKVRVGGLIKARVGSRIDIQCQSQGVPPPVMSWYKDGKRITDGGAYILSEKDMVLTIPSLKIESAGLYSCSASNGIEKPDEADIQLEVYEPISPNFVLKKEESTAEVADPVKWHDVFKTWFKSEKFSSTGTNGNNKSLKDIQVSQLRAHAPPLFSESDEQVGLIGTDYSVLSGVKLVLKCPVVGVPKPFLTWRKEQQIIAKNVDNLVFTKTKTSDMGTYTCIAENAFGSRLETSRIYVVDAQKPTINQEQDVKSGEWKEVFNGASKIDVMIGTNLRTITGTTIVILCPTSGIPKPVLRFYKDDMLVNSSKLLAIDNTNDMLLLRTTTLQNQGVYRCEAENKAGKVENSTTVKLREPVKPNFKEITERPSMTYGLPPSPTKLKISIGTEGTTFVRSIIEVECPVSGFPTPRLLWTVNGKPASDDDSILATTGVLLKYFADKKGKLIFRCTAVNAGGTTSKVAVVQVIDPARPVIKRGTSSFKEDKKLSVNMTIGQNGQVLFGSTVRIRCSVAGAPKPSVMWSSSAGPVFFLPSTRVTQDGNTLQINKVTQRHAVRYKCIASNVIGSAFAESRITVADTSEPQIVHVTRNITVTETTEVTSALIGTEVHAVKGVKIVLECHVSGSPVPEVTWAKDGKPLTHVPSAFKEQNAWFLSLGPIRASHDGTYTCIATNALGNDRASSVIRVGKLPHIQPVPFSSRLVTLLSATKITLPVGAKVKLVSGSTLLLQCLAFGSPGPSVSWYKNDMRIIYESKYQSKVPGLLEISDLALADEGTYTCLAQNLFGKTKLSTKLSIVVPPTIDSIFENITAVGDVRKVHITVGSRLTAQRRLSVSISCPAYGHPIPKVQWVRKNSLFVLDPRIRITADNTLRIDNVEHGDSGTYICVAKNVAGSVNASSVLIVGELPSAQLLPSQRFAAAWKADAPGVEKHQLAVKQGEDVTLNCVVEGDPRPNMAWMKDGVKLDVDGKKYRIVDDQLQISAVQPEDGGRYCCKSSNVIGETMAVVKLMVGDAPFIPVAHESIKALSTETVKARVGSRISATEGSNILLLCDPVGRPQPEAEWWKDGKALVHFSKVKSGDLLTLMNLTLSDSGNYTCIARNGLGMATASSQIFVAEPPSIVVSRSTAPDSRGNTPIDVKLSANKEVSIVEGSVVKMVCAAEGYPPPKISWKQDHFWIRSEYFEGISIEERSQFVKRKKSLVARTISTLTIIAMDSSQTGMYSCMAHNDAGAVSAMIILRTRERPQGSAIGIWVATAWEGCGENCTGSGSSTETREVFCSSLSAEKIAEQHCDASQKPPAEQNCYAASCHTDWKTFPWRQCSEKCGKKGVQLRRVACMYASQNVETDTNNCLNSPGRRPETTRPCNRFPCRDEDCFDSLVYCNMIHKLGYCGYEEFKTKCCRSCTKDRIKGSR